jgi:hypothetical protein
VHLFDEEDEEDGCSVDLTGRRFVTTIADSHSGDASWKTTAGRKIVIGLSILAFLRLWLEYIFQRDRCVVKVMPKLLSIYFNLLACVCSTLTLGKFLCELLDDMSKCNNAIVRLKTAWWDANFHGHCWNVYCCSLGKCRRYVKVWADSRFWPLACNILVHIVVVGICAAQIVIRWSFYHQTILNKSKEGAAPRWIDDPHGVFWYAGIAIIYTLQLYVFLPTLCSINDHADEIVQLVMQLNPPKDFSLTDLVQLARILPVSFPVIYLRLSTAKITGALFAAMASILGLGMTCAKQWIARSH